MSEHSSDDRAFVTEADHAPEGSALRLSLTISCRTCRAKAGDPCVSNVTRAPRYTIHGLRVRDAWRLPVRPTTQGSTRA